MRRASFASTSPVWGTISFILGLLVRGLHELQSRRVGPAARTLSGLSPRENSFCVTAALSGTSHRATGTAGFPWTTVIGGTDRVTTLPAATTAPRPMTTFGNTTA